MRLSWNEIRVRAARFADEWRDATYERGQSQTFYNEFFEVFGVTRRRVATFEEAVKLLDNRRGYIDLFWKGVLLVEQKSGGRDLSKAKAQALGYFVGLKESDLPRYVLVSDFQTFALYDLDEGTELHLTLAELPQHVEAFGFIIGVQRRTFRDQDPVNIEASELMGRLHDALKESGYDGHDLERFLVRLLFCLFADDTGIFEPRDIFLDLVTARTREDGSDLGAWLASLFDVLNTPLERRQKKLDEDLARFPYINGDLFDERLPIPAFDATMRGLLIEACEFSWDAISPAIFGSLFQSVMDKGERRAQGAHYTTEKNILKVIEPLFLDELRGEFAKLKARRSGREAALRAFHQRLGQLTFFDPACGCGNFLIIAYRELRALELELLRELYPDKQLVMDVTTLSRINVDQFYGIELGEFPARIAEVALWMMDHIMNNRLSLEFGEVYARIPLKASPHIHHGDALETDWAAVLPPERCSYVFGNPPFIGAKYQTDAQRQQVRRIARLGGSGGTLDYVAAWFLKAGEYVQNGRASIAFVSTNSITQGEQVAQLWPLLFDRYRLEIAFAHRTFEWGSDARGKAHVHVVIIGLTRHDMEPSVKRLFSYEDIGGEPHESQHKALTAYLFDATRLSNPHLVVQGRARPIGNLSPLVNGNVAADGGNLVFEEARRNDILAREPLLADLIRPFVGGQDFIHGTTRYCFWLVDCPVARIKASPILREIIRAVREMRLASSKLATRERAGTAALFTERRQPPSGRYLAIPRTSSERREYIPIGYLSYEIVAANDLQIVPNANLLDFAIVTSILHNSWARITSGGLESRIRYSAKFTYNTFPTPPASPPQLAKLEPLAQAVLDARAAHPGATLADLYDPDLMPANLRKAHQALDRAVDRLYRKAGFASDRERVEHLFGMYEAMQAPLVAKKKGRARKRSQDTAVTS